MTGLDGGGAGDVARALDLLARRADARPGPDRVPAVRRRARRRAQARTAALAAAVVLAVVGGGALVHLTSRSERSLPAVEPGLRISAQPETDPVILAAAGTGVYGDGTRHAVLQLKVTGYAPGGEYLLIVEQPGLVSSGNPDSRPDCRAAAALQEVRYSELFTLDYPPGPASREQVRITVKACPPLGTVTRSFTVTLPAKAGVLPAPPP